MFYVYVDWTEEAVPRAYYVGKGNADRAGDVNVFRNEHHLAISRQFGQTRVIHFETPSEGAALVEEARLIRELKTGFGLPGNFGANIVIGGAQSGSHGKLAFQTMKGIHIKLDHSLHAKFRSKTFELGTNMQTSIQIMTEALASNDPYLIELIKRELKRRQ
jgi:hypothetical protein